MPSKIVSKFLLLVIIFLFCTPSFSQIKREIQDEWPVRSAKFYQGFLTPFEGERLDFLQNLQDQSVALLVRADSGRKYLEFEGEPVINSPEKQMTFIWEMAIAKHTGGEKEPANFDLLINGEKKFQFHPVKTTDDLDWTITNQDGTELSFVKTLTDEKGGDAFGFMFLTINKKDYEVGKSVRIKILGGKNDSPDWFMAFQNVVKSGATAEILPALERQNSALKQPLEIKYNHLGVKTNANIKINNVSVAKTPISPGNNEITHYLIPTENHQDIKVQIEINDEKFAFDLVQKPVRKFEVYFLPHSHIDIGFTHLQSEVEKMQWRNIEQGIALAEKTKDYPKAAQYKWNVEIMWAVDSYLKTASAEKKAKFVEAVKNGWIGLDALLGSELTGLQREEELMHITDAANQYERNYGIETETAMITDVPGYSWGTVSALVKNGVKYFSVGPNHMPHLPNGGYQVGNTFHAWGDIPFYWKSPSGNEKVLFWMSSHGYSWFHDWLLGTLDKSGGTPILKFLNELEDEAYPYDIVQLRYTMGDNAGPDVGMPDFIKNWNEKYEFPKFRISTTAELFEDFEAQYGATLPTYGGDFSPYWEDGAASSALETGINRNSADRLVQAETLWAINRDVNDFPKDLAYEAWRNVLLFSEHTWGAISSKSDPDSDFTTDQWKVKQSFAIKADSISKELLSLALSAPNQSYEHFVVYNTSSWTRSDLVTIPDDSKITNKVLLCDGEEIPFQTLKNGDIAFIAEEINPFSSKKYQFKAKKGALGNLYIGSSDSTLITKNLTIKIGPNGSIKSIIRKGIEEDFVNATSEFGFNEYWYTGLNAKNPSKSSNSSIKVIESGPILTEIEVKSDAPGTNELIRKITTVYDLDRIDIVNTVDKLKILEDENVRFSFPFNVPNFTTKIDQAYHIMTPDFNQLKGANKNFFCAQRFIDFSNSEYGVTIANLDAPLIEMGGMYGQDWMRDMRNRPWKSEHISSSLLFSWVMNNAWFVNYKGHQEGLITSRYRIKTHEKWSDADRKKFGVEQSQPLIAVPSTKNARNLESLFEIQGSESMLVSSVKPSMDGSGIIVKMINASSENASFSIHFKDEKQIYLSDNKEIIGAPIDGEQTADAWDFIILKIVNQ